jgi:hypothetical protein
MSQRQQALTGLAILVGGLLWIAIDVLVVTFGFQTGKLATNLASDAGVLAASGIWLLPLSLFPLGLGLLGIFVRLHGHSRALGVTGAACATLGMLLGAVDLLDLAGVFGPSAPQSSFLGGFGAFAVIIGTAFLGVAALRTRTLPRRLAWTLIVIGLVTIPILFATPLPLGPAWATATVAFLLSGLAFDAVGVTLLEMRSGNGAPAPSVRAASTRSSHPR